MSDNEHDLVWHYTDATGLLSILRNNTLWATSSQFLNDRGEIELGQRLAADRMAELADADPDSVYAEVRAQMAEQQQVVPERPSQDQGGAIFFVLSASTSSDSLAMWRNYGGAGESYAIGLDPEAPLRIIGTPPAGGWLNRQQGSAEHPQQLEGSMLRCKPWRRVRYARADQLELIDVVLRDRAETVEALKDGLQQAARSADPDALRHSVDDQHLRDMEAMFGDLEDSLLLVKHPGFVDEDEVRASVVLWLRGDRPRLMADLADVVQYRSSRYGLAPYLRLTGPGDDPDETLTPTAHPLPIRAVTVSPSAHGNAAEQSVRDLLAAYGRCDVPVTRSGIPFRE